MAAEKVTKMPRKRRIKPSRHRGSMKIIFVLVVLVCLFIGYQTWQVRKQTDAYKATAEQVTQQIADAEDEQEELEAEAEYQNSLDYIEDIAREKFGLVFPNEIIFRKK